MLEENTNPYYNTYEKLVTAIDNIDKMSYRELYHTIASYYPTLFEHLEDRHSVRLAHLYTNPRFLFVLLQVLSHDDPNYEKRRLINSFIRSTLLKCNDSNIRDIAYMVAKYFNYDMVNKLGDLNTIDPELCLYLSVTSQSSTRDYVNINRVNYTICNFSYYDLTPRDIINIYHIIHPKNFTDVFVISMANEYIDRENIKEDIKDRAIRIEESLKRAMCMILETFDTGVISQILISYNEYCMFNNSEPSNLMHYINTIDGFDFVKLPIIIRELEKQEIYFS